MGGTCHSGDTAWTQPRVRRCTAGQTDDVELVILLQVETFVDPGIALRCDYSRNDNWVNYSGDFETTELTVAEIDRRGPQGYDEVPENGREWLEAQVNYAGIRAELAASGDPSLDSAPTRFYELRLTEPLPYGELARYEIAVRQPGEAAVSTCRSAVWLVQPEFGPDSLRISHAARSDQVDDWYQDSQHWVLMTTTDERFHHLRLDFLSRPTDPDVPDIVIELTGTNPPVKVELSGPSPYPDTVDRRYVRPILDRTADSIVVSIAREGWPEGLSSVTVVTNASQGPGVDDTTPVDLTGSTEPYGYRPVALVLIQYCIQALNDLFEKPIDAYDPPRNYIEITYEDEHALFSSRPEQRETGIPDGYRYTLLAEKAFGVRTHWAFNAGTLLLMRHGLGASVFQEIHDRVASPGGLSPAIAGEGARRPPYYQAETNRRDIQYDARLVQDLFGRPPAPIYYPDQRTYKATPGEIKSYLRLRNPACPLATSERGDEQGVVQYLVLDRSTVAHLVDGEEQCYFGIGKATGDQGNYLWTDKRTGMRLLLIEDEFRDQLVAADEDECRRGQLYFQLRRRFMRNIRHPADAPSKIMVYADDCEKVSGNGWFDSTDAGNASWWLRIYLAALHWMTTHPWVQTWTVDDPGFDPNLYLQPEPLDVSSAIDAYMDPNGAEDNHGGPDNSWTDANNFRFDDWYQTWANTRSAWLDRDLRSLSDELEKALINHPSYYRNGLYEIAWKHYLLYTHESFWSKQPVDTHDGKHWDPEDFVVSESLQQRNAWVYLNASIWADWAAQPCDGAPDETWAIGPESDLAVHGPLLDLLQRAGTADPYWKPADPETSGRYLDHDCLQNIVLYNRQVMLVIDRNGGRITHIFGQVNQRQVSLSGNCKAPQFLSVVPAQNAGPATFDPACQATGPGQAYGMPLEVQCDGPRLDNTPFTANHAYVATDVLQAAPRLGTFSDPRNDGPELCWIPDLFNHYECDVDRRNPSSPTVTCSYLQQSGLLPEVPAWDSLQGLLARDGTARRSSDGEGVVWHPFRSFSKTIRLTGRRITISYEDVEPGHQVANEFSPDLERLLNGEPGVVKQSRGHRSMSVTGPRNVTLTLALGENCSFLPGASATVMPSDRRLWGEYGRLNRIMSTDLRLVCKEGGDFSYHIDCP